MPKITSSKQSAPKQRKIGPYSRPDRWAIHDGRRSEGKLLRQVREELTKHVGGSPSITQRLLIERTAWMVLHVSMLDSRALREGGFSEHATKEYLAWSNTIRRSLIALGMKGAATDDSAALSELLGAE